jgi:hypothetical protein
VIAMLTPPPDLFTTASDHDAIASRIVFLLSIFAIIAIAFIGGDPQ